MQALYTKLAGLYHQMYQSIFDDDTEFRNAHRLLKPYSPKSVLEVGCGAGNLATRFSAAGYEYTGMDVAKPMLRIAARENPLATFLQGDMRRFTVKRKFDAIIVRGRSFTYMTRNEDVLSALHCFRKALRPRGVLVFDNFDAESIFTDLARPLRDMVRVGDKTISRLSKRTPNLRTGWTWNWDATYVVKEGRKARTFRDRSVLRAFTPDELALFLRISGFTRIHLQRQHSVIEAVAQV